MIIKDSKETVLVDVRKEQYPRGLQRHGKITENYSWLRKIGSPVFLE